MTGVSQVRIQAECVVVSFAAGATGTDQQVVATSAVELVDALRARLATAVVEGIGQDLRFSQIRTWTGHTDAGESRCTAEARGRIRLDDLSAVGPMLAGLAAQPGVTIQDLEWRLSDETVAEHQPRVIQEAFRNARQRAGWIAEAAGSGGVTVVAVRDDGAPVFARAMALRSGPALALDPEDVEIAAHLTVDFDTV